MTQLRLVYSGSNKRTPLSDLHSIKLRMSRANLESLPPICQKVARLHFERPAAAALIEKLVDDALRRIAG